MNSREVDFKRFVGVIEIELRKLIHDVAMAVEAKQDVKLTVEVMKDDPWTYGEKGYIINPHPFSAPGQEIIKWTVEIRK